MLYPILILFLLICGGLAIVTALNLSTQVHLSLFTWQTPDLPVGFWVMAAFFLGALLLYLVSVASALGDRREIKTLRKRIAELEQLPASASKIPMSTSPMPGTSGQQAQMYKSGPLMPMPGSPPPNSDLPPQNFRQ